MSEELSRVLPSLETLHSSRSTLLKSLPEPGLGLGKTSQHLQETIVPGLNGSSKSPHYYGFVTGGSTPAASYADNLVTEHDQNAASRLPDDSIVADVEDAALAMLGDLLNFLPDHWPHQIFTTGATASNVLGLACGREYVVQEAARRQGKKASVAEDGLFAAMNAAAISNVQILTTAPHSSLRKAASIVGLGSQASIRDVGRVGAPHQLDIHALEQTLKKHHPSTASIVSISCAEVNSGLFATSGEIMRSVRKLCDGYGAWLHVDAAFGLQARCLLGERKEYPLIVDGVLGLELADSITGDAHKLLNVPYDCGIFLSRHLEIGTQVFRNAGAAYLNTAASELPSPLNIGIENSRRFRALPVYATLASYGHDGYRELLIRQITLARSIALFILEHPAYELLPLPTEALAAGDLLERIYVIVLFRAKDAVLNGDLVHRVNATRRISVSGSAWESQPAARFAVANWQVDVERDMKLIAEVLQEVAA